MQFVFFKATLNQWLLFFILFIIICWCGTRSFPPAPPPPSPSPSPSLLTFFFFILQLGFRHGQDLGCGIQQCSTGTSTRDQSSTKQDTFFFPHEKQIFINIYRCIITTIYILNAGCPVNVISNGKLFFWLQFNIIKKIYYLKKTYLFCSSARASALSYGVR